MSMLSSAARGIKNIWSHGDDDYDAEDEDLGEADDHSPAHTSHSPTSTNKYSDHKFDSKHSTSNYTPAYGGGSISGSRARSLRSVPIPVRAREKNIYTLRPKTLEEAAIAADYLKAGSAVVVNLESVDTTISVRIIDFMSGVCYGLEGQGHAMKLGDSIFLFTPGEFEISSDELDYGENRDFFFKDVDASVAPMQRPAQPSPAASSAVQAPAAANAYTSSFANAYNTPQQYHNVAATPAAESGGASGGHASGINAAAAHSPLSSSIRRNPTPQSTFASSQPVVRTTSEPRAATEPRAQTVPSSSVYGTSGKAHVTIGGRPAPTTVMSPAPRSTSSGSTSSGGARSWER